MRLEEKTLLSSSQAQMKEQFCLATQAVVTSAKCAGDGEKHKLTDQRQGGGVCGINFLNILCMKKGADVASSGEDYKRDFLMEEKEQKEGAIKEGIQHGHVEKAEGEE